MRYFQLFLFLGMFHFTVFSQTRETWEFSLITSNDLYLIDIINHNNQLFISGWKRIPESNYQKGFVYKLTESGQLVDSTFLSKTDTAILMSNFLNGKNEKLILSYVFSDTTPNHTNSGFCLEKIDTLLSLSDIKQFPFPSNFGKVNLFIRYSLDSSILVSGAYYNPYTPRMYIYNTSNKFDSIKARYYPNANNIYCMDIKQLSNKSYWLIQANHSKYVLIDSSLNLISSSQGAIPRWIKGNYGIKWDSDTSFYLVGDYIANLSRFTDHDLGFFHQFDPFDSTNIVFNSWQANDTVDFPAFFGALDYTNKDSIYIGGIKNMVLYDPWFGKQPSWYVLLQTDSMLNIRWERFYGGDACYNMTKLIATSDGGCIMAGTRFDFKEHPMVRERDIYILKVNSEGLITSNGKVSSIVHEAIVYPNPGKEYLKVRVGVQHKQSTVKLFDITGRMILKNTIEGTSAIINTQFLKSGTYVYTITNNNGLNEIGKWVKE